MNKKHIFLIIALVIIIYGAGLLLMNRFSELKSKEPPINQSSENLFCEDLYKEIENDIVNANYCQTNSDCDVLILGGWYIEFGCYHFINKDVDHEQFYKKMEVYKQKCSQIINMCAPVPEAKCISNKCVYIKE